MDPETRTAIGIVLGAVAGGTLGFCCAPMATLTLFYGQGAPTAVQTIFYVVVWTALIFGGVWAEAALANSVNKDGW